MAGPLGEMFDHGVFAPLLASCLTLSKFISVGCDAINTTVRLVHSLVAKA